MVGETRRAAKHSEPGGVVGGGGDQEGNQTFRAGRSGGGDQEGSSWLVARLAYGISTLCISPGQLPG